MTFRSGARSSGASSSCSSSARSASSSCSPSARSTFAIVAAASCRVPPRCVVSCCRFADARSMCARPPAFLAALRCSFRLRSASRIPGAVLRNRSAARSPGRARRSLSFALCSVVSWRLLSATLTLNDLDRFGLKALLLVLSCGFRTARDLLSEWRIRWGWRLPLRQERIQRRLCVPVLCKLPLAVFPHSSLVLYAHLPPFLLFV